MLYVSTIEFYDNFKVLRRGHDHNSRSDQRASRCRSQKEWGRRSLQGRYDAEPSGASEDILLPSRARAEQREREKAAKRKLELMDQGSKLFAAACRESGIDMVKAQPSDDEELKRNAYADRYGEEMSWLYE